MKLCRSVTGILLGLCLMVGAGWAQQGAPQSAAPQAGAGATNAPSAGFSIQGVVRSGTTMLPGVSVAAAHSLSGRKVITSTNVDGSFRLNLPSKGRWVLHVEFAAFATQTAELVLTPAQPEATHDFELVLLSRVPKAAEQGGVAGGMNGSGHRGELGSTSAFGGGAQRLTMKADDAALAQSATLGEVDTSQANVSGLAASEDATNQSVSVNGRIGNAQSLGLQNMDDLHDRIDQMRARGQLGGSGFDSGNAGGGGFGLGGQGGGGGGRFRMGSLTRPHGQIYYNASNAALDAAPYSLTGPSEKSAYGSNKFGAMVGGPLKIPHVYDDGGKTFFFMNYSGIRSSTPYDMFSHVPTEAERAGDFSGTLVNGSQVQLYDPQNAGALLGGGTSVPANRISAQALYLLGANPQNISYIPLPNVPGAVLQNYHFSSAAESDQDIFALRLTHNFGAPTGRGGFGGGGRSGRPRNNLSLGLNYQRNESGILEAFSTVGGETHTNGYNANVGWAISRGKLSNQLRFTWNRSRAHTDGYYAGIRNVSGDAGIGGVSGGDPLNWGVPGLVFSDYTSLSDVAPSQRDSQTFTLSESFGWVRGKHHLHFGGDYRWIDNKAYASSNPRGTFTFTGSSTAQYITNPQTGLPATVTGTGYDFADFLLGYAQQTSLAYSAVHNQFLGDSYDSFAQDDWRARGNLTLNIGLRYEFISPFHEAHDQLENLIPLFDAAGNFLGTSVVVPGGAYGRTLMYPHRENFAPRIGIAWKPVAKTVVRAGYSINYNLGQYASIVQKLAAQPPYAVTETNAAPANAPNTYLTLGNGFPSPTANMITNNYGVDPHYRVPYVQMWNLNVQHELTSTLLVNVGYTGSKGSALDMLRAPNRGPEGLIIPTVEPFNWETTQGSSILHAGSVRVRKRMTNGFSVGGTYTYAKSIDNASSIGGGAQVVAQNDKDLRAERGLSSFDQRHKLSADWLLELPWGTGRKWLTRPSIKQTVLGSWMLQGSVAAASGTPFTARVLGSLENVAGGVNGTLRADYNGEPIQLSDRSIKRWFNTAAFTAPAPGTYGSAGRNTIIGPGNWAMNLVLSKNIPMKESMGLEMRAEADNVLNHPNYSGIDTTVNSPTFGQVTSVASMRKMVMSLHYRF